jgi:hypothetical protein
LYRSILDRQRNRSTLLGKYVVPDEEASVSFNSFGGHKLAGVRSLYPEIDNDTQIKFGGSEYVPLKRPGLGSVDQKYCPDNDGIGAINAAHLECSVFLDLFDHRRGGHRLDIGSEGIILEDWNRNITDPSHKGWGDGTDRVASATGETPEQNAEKKPAHRATGH